MQKIKRDDDVIVIAGKDKGKRGSVTKTLHDRVIVSGVNMVKRHTKGNPQMNKPGGIIEKETAIHISNVAIFNAAKGKADRVAIKILEDGAKVRIFASSGEEIDG